MSVEPITLRKRVSPLGVRAVVLGCGIALSQGVLAGPAVAHLPRIVGAARTVRVTEPEVSKAYYARLPGVPARYTIASAVPFAFYAQTTVPDVPWARRDLRMRVLGPAGELARLTTPAAAWKRFYEPFGGNRYLTGPEFRRRVPAGRYAVEVSDRGNRGIYVLAIGEAERWDPVEAARALAALPAIKRDYFGRPTRRRTSAAHSRHSVGSRHSRAGRSPCHGSSGGA